MPKDETLTPVNFPMKLRFDEKPTTVFKNDLEALTVELIEWPDPVRCREMVYQFVNATWEDAPGVHDPDEVPQWEHVRALEMALQFKALPTVLENINFVFRISGIDVQTVTHLIRHRTGSFSAQCTGDRWQTHAAALVPGPIMNSPELYERWRKVVEDAKELYCDMINTRQISIMDARTILPKCLETHYYARFTLKDIVAFIQQRVDRAIQPCVDNLMAYYITLHIAAIFPEITSVVDFDAPSKHFIKTARTGKATNLYWPEEHNDKFNWHPKDFIYQGTREEINGTDPDSEFVFNYYKQKCTEDFNNIKASYTDWKVSVGWKEAE